MLRYCTSSWTSAHTWCYATLRLAEFPHIHNDATLLYVFLDFLTYMMLRYCTSSCTSSHTWRWENTGTSLFQKTAKVLNETVQSRWLFLAIEKNARRNVLKPAYFKKTAKKKMLILEAHECRKHCKTHEKGQNTVARRISWTELFAKTMRFASNV